MSWLKMARWVLIGAVATGGAAACGGRGNLPTGEASAGDANGGQTFAGSFSFGARAGTSAIGGASTAGTSSTTGGTFPGAGAPSTGGTAQEICVPGLSMCEGNAIAICVGTGYARKDCGQSQRCVQQGDTPACVPLLCKPGQMLCDSSARYVQVCAADGASGVNKVDCGAQGQRCQDGVCRSLACQPNQLFCDKTGVRLCNADGSASTLRQACGANQYCDPLAPSCKKGICAPGQPACNGSVATTCNADGSGYLAMGIDCAAQPDRQCVQGACLCPPDLADCDGLAKTGCESNVSTDPDNCTGCGLACSANHIANRTCDDGCNGSCATGFQDCNGDKLKDGCETATGSDVKNCGGCGLACSNSHITASCTAGVCDGACVANFADCNGSKLKDGCESDSRTDAKNCGGCGLSCSNNHAKPRCQAGSCDSPCEDGFDDCNGDKLKDGCEIDTQTDPQNCGGCGNVCPSGWSCTGGACSSLFTFSGVMQNVPVASLTGWTQCYTEVYAQNTTSIADLRKACSGSLLMMACRTQGSSTLQIAAYAPRADVFFDTGVGNDTHQANGVGWYFSGSRSWGFAPAGDDVLRDSCDTRDSTISAVGTDGDLRLCWHTGGDFLQGGWRCGRNDNLNASYLYERVLFQAP